MNATTPEAAQVDRLEQLHRLQVQRHLPRNYLAHAIEGGLYMGGMRFVPTDTLGPVMVASLGGPAWLMAVMPIAMPFGYVFPQILTAHWIEGMTRHKPLVVFLGFFQRLPYLAAALALLLGGSHPQLALPVVACAPLLMGLIAGVGGNAWQELVAKTVPVGRRSSLFAVRNILTAGLGLAAGGIIAAVLREYPGPAGYGVLHLITFGLLAASFVAFQFIREIPYPHPPPPRTVTLGQSLRQMPGLIARDARYRNYLISDAFMAGVNIMMPFLAIHALARLDKADDYLGLLVVVQMVGSIAGNLAAGVLGDRYGGKSVLRMSQAGLVIVCVWAALAGRAWEFMAIFFVLGCAMFSLWVGRGTLVLEITPNQRRASYLAILGTISVPSMLLAWLLSYLTWKLTGHSFACVAALSAVSVLLSAAFLSRVAEPRRQGIQG